MSSEEKNAEEMMRKGEHALKRFSFFSSSSKYDDAIECFTRAANLYKIAKQWHDAGNAFVKVAECHVKLKSAHDAAAAYTDAAKMFKRVDNSTSVVYYTEAVQLYCEIGRFSVAAKLEKEIAEAFEAEGDLEEAIAHYQKAADYFMGEDATSAANTCRTKVALFSAQLERYEPAIEIFEQIGSQCLENNLLKYNAKSYFFQAGLCHLCMTDVVATRRAIEQYKGQDFTFSGSRECKLLEDITTDFEEANADAFTDHVFNFDSISKLDPWKTTMLLRIKNAIKGIGGEGGEEDDLR